MKRNSKQLLVVICLCYPLSVNADGGLQPLTEAEMESTVYHAKTEVTENQTAFNDGALEVDIKIDASQINTSGINSEVKTFLHSNVDTANLPPPPELGPNFWAK